ELCDIIEAALAKDSWERTPSAAAFGQALTDLQPRPGSTPAAGAETGRRQAVAAPVSTSHEEHARVDLATRRRNPLPPNRSAPPVSPPPTPDGVSSDHGQSAGQAEGNGPGAGDGVHERETR